MGTRDPRIDQYIAKQADFARPILTHLREVVHSACPDVEEATKWGAPFFMYHGPLCSMAGFKQHCGFGFWKGSLVVWRVSGEDDRAAGQFGRITSVKDLPSKKELTAFIRKAMTLNEEGVTVPKEKRSRPTLPVPPELTAALAKNAKARKVFEAFSPSQQRDYSEWIAGAKREDTKSARVKQAVEWMAEGKPRHWKYETR